MAISYSQDDDGVLSEINITPLVDVMLVLLVAFILTIPVLANAVHVNLPKTVQTPPPEDQKSVTVTVDQDGKVYLGSDLVEGSALESQLRALRAASDSPSVHVRADDRVPYGSVAKVMALIQHSGIERVSLLTTSE